MTTREFYTAIVNAENLSAELTEKAAELQKKIDEMTAADARRTIREKVAKETGVPADLLSGDTEEACKEQAEKINAYARPSAYPAVPDAGELQQRVGGDPIQEALRKVNKSLERS